MAAELACAETEVVARALVLSSDHRNVSPFSNDDMERTYVGAVVGDERPEKLSK